MAKDTKKSGKSLTVKSHDESLLGKVAASRENYDTHKGKSVTRATGGMKGKGKFGGYC